MTEIQVAGKKCSLSSTIIGYGVKFPYSGEKDWTKHNKFKVTVCCKNGDETCESFNYHTSHVDWQANRTKMSDEDRQYAFRAFLDDAIAGMSPFDEFCSEFGYDCYGEDSGRAKRVHNSVKASLRKAKALGFSEDELYKALEELSEAGIE